jgi:hypothetical protein
LRNGREMRTLWPNKLQRTSAAHHCCNGFTRAGSLSLGGRVDVRRRRGVCHLGAPCFGGKLETCSNAPRTSRASANRALRDCPSPDYLGFLVTWAGMFLVLGELRALVCFAHTKTVLKRARAEEDILRAAYPNDYPAYERRVKRLLPCIW